MNFQQFPCIFRSEEDYEGDIMEYGEDPDVSGIANDFIGQCRLAGKF
jgi:hypothetical protein